MITRRKFIAGLGSAVAWPLGATTLWGAQDTMDVSKDDFLAWFEPGAGGKIVVIGKVTEVDGSTTTLVRAEPQGIDPHTLMLKIHIEPYKGRFHPHTAFKREIRYEEPAEKKTFTDVYIERKGGNLTLKVEAAPK